MLMVSTGIQAPLVGLRAEAEGFDTLATGVVMSAYYLGFLVGSRYTPALVRRVGHVRVFAALASLASSSIVVLPLAVHPAAWVLLRTLLGASMAGLYLTVESWLNSLVGNQSRGSLLGTYILTSMCAMSVGQMLSGTAPPTDVTLFVVASVLSSTSLVPLALSSGRPPRVERAPSVDPGTILRKSPAGFATALLAGATEGSLFTMTALWGTRSGFSDAQVGLMLSAATFGAVTTLLPLGHTSDRLGRRLVIGVTSIAAAVAAAFVSSTGPFGWGTVAVFFAFGALAIPHYCLGAALVNDRLRPAEMVTAGGMLVSSFGLGAIAGPMVVAVLVELMGTDGFPVSLALFQLASAAGVILGERRPVRAVPEGVG